MKKPKMNRRYIVVTPCRNEAKNLPKLVQSMVSQTLRPLLWVIVDDGSIDRTGEIIAEVEEKYGWIKGLHLEKCEEYMGTHLAYVCNKGFEFAREYCDREGISYEYIALVDADNILEAGYFEKLIEEFEKDEKLGIASGNSAFADVEKILNDLKIRKPDITVMDNEFWQMWDDTSFKNGREDLPMGSARIWKKECFEETGGYAYVHAPDSVSNVKAKMKGWKTKRFKHIRVIEREGLIAEGTWKGYKNRGRSDFFLWYPIYFALLKALKYSFKRPHYHGIAYFLGYIESFISGKKRTNDTEIRQYYQSIRPNEMTDYYKEKFRKLLK